MRIKNLSNWENSRLLAPFALLIIFLYYLPFFYNGQDSHVLIHDNLDSNVVWVKTLLESGEVFSSPGKYLPQVFNGIPRASLYGTYDLSLLWFALFGIYEGYIFNKVLMSLVGFAGMYHLLKKYFLPQDTPMFIPVGVALLFSLLPFWSFTLSVCGLPLLLYAFLNIRKGENNFMSWLMVVLFPFYSSLVLSGVFFIALLLVLLVYDFYETKRFNGYFLLGIVVLSVLYIASHYPLFYMFLLDSDHVSHRMEFSSEALSFTKSLKKAASVLVLGQYHAHSLHTFILLPVLLVAVKQLYNRRIDKKAFLLLIIIAVTSLVYGFISWRLVQLLQEKMMSLIPFQVQRFHFLHPMLWYLLLSLSLVVIYKSWRFGKQAVVFVLVLQLGFIVKRSYDIRTEENAPSFRRFYAQELFQEIKRYIGKPLSSYRVISVGIYPSVAQYNGLYTLDGYYPDYPLEHKHLFREVICKELNKDIKLKSYFDNWGSRCYAFSAELGSDYMNPNPGRINRLDFNFNALKKMGGEYILSSAEIDTSKNKELQLLKTFKHPDSHWKINLYGIAK